MLVPRILLRDGTFVYPEIDPVSGLFTIDQNDLVAETTFAAIEGPGIKITPGGEHGHAPTVEVAVDPTSPIPLTFVSLAGEQCLHAQLPVGTDPHWGPATTITSSGVTVIPGGVNGHSPQFKVAIDPAGPFSFDSSGRLQMSLTSIQSQLAAAKLIDIGDVADAIPPTGYILVFNNISQIWEPWHLMEIWAALIGAPNQRVPVAPQTGPPVYLKYDPINHTVGWNPS